MNATVNRRTSGRNSAAVAILTLLLAACGSSTATPPRTAEPPPVSTTSAVPAATASEARSSEAPTSSAPSPSASTAAFDPASVKLALKLVVGGFDQPLGIANAADGSDRLFIVEQPGLVRVVKTGALVGAPFLDVRKLVSCCGERGLLGLAFAPGFGTKTNEFFVDYTDANGDTVIARGTAGASADTADLGLKALLTIKQPYPNHNGGDLNFGPDGYLYIGMGDGGSGGDPQGNGQSLDTLLGKLLRIDVVSPRGVAQLYNVPADNPFVGQSDARPEIWSYGLRNPWRFSFDRSTGALWIGDVGQDRYEEVDRALTGGRGDDYGWNVVEARHCYLAQACDGTAYVAPIAEYSHTTGDCAVVGGYVYRGSAYPGLTGAYLFGDECSGRIRAVSADGPASQDAAILLDTDHATSSFGEDEAGEVYLTDLASGELYQVTAPTR